MEKIKHEYRSKQYAELPVPDPKGPYGQSLLRIDSEAPPLAFFDGSHSPIGPSYHEERWELRRVGEYRWIEVFGNDTESYGYWQITTWHTWERKYPVDPKVKTQLEAEWQLQEENLQLKAHVRELEQALHRASLSNLGGLYREMLREEASGNKADQRTDQD